MPLTIPPPSTSALASARHPAQFEPVFSTVQREDERDGQTLTVTVHFAGGGHDSETVRLADYGNWVPAEDVTAAEELATRRLNRRIQAKSAVESKPSESKP